MSSSENIIRSRPESGTGLFRQWRYLLIGGVALGLAGCFTPVYAPTASAPGGVAEQLKQIDVGTVRVSGGGEVMAHELRSELIFALDGERTETVEKRYRITAVIAAQRSSPIISTATGRAAAGAISANVTWQIEDLETERIVLAGSQRGEASYDRTDQRFAALRARREAEQRLARQLARHVATQIAIDFRTGQHKLSRSDNS